MGLTEITKRGLWDEVCSGENRQDTEIWGMVPETLCNGVQERGYPRLAHRITKKGRNLLSLRVNSEPVGSCMGLWPLELSIHQ